jgi:hypothetical protein
METIRKEDDDDGDGGADDGKEITMEKELSEYKKITVS